MNHNHPDVVMTRIMLLANRHTLCRMVEFAGSESKRLAFMVLIQGSISQSNYLRVTLSNFSNSDNLHGTAAEKDAP